MESSEAPYRGGPGQANTCSRRFDRAKSSRPTQAGKVDRFTRYRQSYPRGDVAYTVGPEESSKKGSKKKLSKKFRKVFGKAKVTKKKVALPMPRPPKKSQPSTSSDSSTVPKRSDSQ